MPKFNFSKVTKPIEKIEEVTKEVNDTADNKVNSILYDYHVIASKKVDKTKTYYDAFFKSLILFTYFEAKSYNILQRWDADSRTTQFFVALYADEVEDAVKIKRDYTGGYKIYTYNIIVFPLGITIAFNVFTIILIGIFGLPAVVGLCLFSILIF